MDAKQIMQRAAEDLGQINPADVAELSLTDPELEDLAETLHSRGQWLLAFVQARKDPQQWEILHRELDRAREKCKNYFNRLRPPIPPIPETPGPPGFRGFLHGNFTFNL
jgi:hypothetical protein